MASVLELTENPTFGKHIIAKCDIDVGREVVATAAFASIQYLKCASLGCFHCGQETNRRIQCPHCIDVHFCSEQCSLNKVHRKICNPMFSHTDCETVRLVTEIIIAALTRAPDAKTCLEFARDILFSKHKPQNIQATYPQYNELLQLKGKPEKEHLLIARQTVKHVMSQVELDSVVDFERILFHLAYRHATCIASNSFSEETIVSKGGISIRYELYDILSRFNHSCSPNLNHFIDDNNITHCVVVRPIKKGEQLFINYLCQMKLDYIERQKYIEQIWHFKCQCIRCAKNIRN